MPRASIRIFLSSTFHDMQAERDMLVRGVLPEVRHRCRERATELVVVDLRWGVTDEDARREGALSICLREIARCDVFLCMLGRRYGWAPIPEEIPTAFFARELDRLPQDDSNRLALEAHYELDELGQESVFRLRRSEVIPEDVAERIVEFWESAGLPHSSSPITEQEIFRGALGQDVARPSCLFYSRESDIDEEESLPDVLRSRVVEQDPKRLVRLEQLKVQCDNQGESRTAIP